MHALLQKLEDQLVSIPAGEISLRDDRLNRKWNVEIDPFLISRIPVTQSLFAEVTGKWPSTFKEEEAPVESVSWLDAAHFCNRLSALAGLPECYQFDEANENAESSEAATGYRLPVEAEWEYAARAGTKGPRFGEIDTIAWYASNSDGKTHPVGQKQPNDWGLYDMLGNVWEWCSDTYDPEVYGTYRIFRGGGWADGERGCLATNRRRSHPTFAIDDLGFRVARSIEPQPS